VVIEGNGAHFILDRSVANTGFLRAIGTTELSVRNIRLTREKKIGLALKVVSVDTDGNSFVVERADDSYMLPSEDSQQYDTPNLWTIDPTSKKIKFGTTLSVIVDQERSGVFESDKWQYFLDTQKYPRREYVINNLAPNDILLSGQKYGNRKEIYLVRSKNIIIYNFDTDSTGLTFHVSANKCENLTILKCDFLRDGLHGPVSDGIHIKDLRGGAWIEGNRIESNGDDAIAIHPAKHNYIWDNERTIRISNLEDIAVGDELHFYDLNLFLSKALVTQVTLVTQVNESISKFEVILDTNVPALSSTNVNYRNYMLAAPDTVLRGNVLDGNRGEGFHLTLHGAIIENNLLRDIGERAFTFLPTEGGGSYSRRVMIQRNVFLNLKRFDDLSDISYGALITIRNGSSSERLVEQFQIRYNAVFGYPNTLLSFKGAHHITISKNYLNASPYHDSPDRKSLETSAINVLDNTDSIIYEANRFIGFRGRPKSEFIDTTDAANFNSDNPNFDAQFFNKAWQLDAINVNSSLAKYSFGESIPNRSLTTIALSGAGYIVGGATQDKLTFINVPMVEQGAIYMKITDLQVPDSTSFGRGGLMIRETKEVSSTFSMISVRELGNSMYLQHIFRNGRGNNLKAGKTSAAITLPIWLALKRQGNIFSSYHSDDGEAWHLFYQNIMEMGSTYDIGIAVSSQDDNLVTKLKGDEVLVDTDLKYHISLSGGSSICATGTEDNCVLLGCIWKNNKCTSCSTSIENEDNCLNAGCNWKSQ